MAYELIWEAPFHEFADVQCLAIMFALLCICSAIYNFVNSISHDYDENGTKKYKHKREYLGEGLREICIAVLVVAIGMFCYFNNLLNSDDTFIQYHNGDYKVIEGKISDYYDNGHYEGFCVGDIPFKYNVQNLNKYSQNGMFCDFDDRIYKNGQTVKIAYTSTDGIEYNIARIELLEQ